LFERYSHLTLGVCLKYLKNYDEAQDAVINIFEKLIEDLLKHEVSNFSSWLHSVARNHCLMHLRSQQSKDKKIIAMQAEYLPDYDNMEVKEKEAKETELNNLEAAIEQLKPEQKICIELFYLQQKCYTEVATLSGFSLKQVKSYIQNGKRNLRLILEKQQNESVYTR